MRSGSTRETKRRKGGRTTAGPAGAQGKSAPDQDVDREGAGDGERRPGMPLAFSFNGQKVRTVIEAGETWFVAADVCAVLEHPNVSHGVARLDDDEKGITDGDTLGGEQEMLTVSESGLYNLIFTSRKPEARAFRRWVTSEVIPSICKTGRYQMGEHQEVWGGSNERLSMVRLLQCSSARSDANTSHFLMLPLT